MRDHRNEGSGVANLEISCVIPTLNESVGVKRLVRSINVRGGVRPSNIFVVDGGSCDHTVDVAGTLGASVIALSQADRRVTTRRVSGMTGVARARNLGLQEVTTPAVVFLDADMEVTGSEFSQVRDLIGRGTRAVTIGEKSLGNGIIARARDWERRSLPFTTWTTAPRAFDVQLIREIGGYREDMEGFEDLELNARLLEMGIEIGTTSERILHHEEGVTLFDYLRKHQRYVRGAARLRELHPRYAREMLSLPRWLVEFGLGFRAEPSVTLAAASMTLKCLDAASLLLRARISQPVLPVR